MPDVDILNHDNHIECALQQFDLVNLCRFKLLHWMIWQW
jgi:hypothetical protein